MLSQRCRSLSKEIKKEELVLTTPKGELLLENDFVLALTGYRPNFNFLETLGIALSNDNKRHPEYNPDTMETNVEGIYLAGVICGGMETHKWFIFKAAFLEILTCFSGIPYTLK